MSFAIKAQAVVAANKLIRKMKTKGWKPHIFKNMGWHFTLLNGSIQLSEYEQAIGKPYYNCLIGLKPGDSGAPTFWCEDGWWGTEFSKEPNACVKRALDVAYTVIEGYRESVSSAYKSAGLTPELIT